MLLCCLSFCAYCMYVYIMCLCVPVLMCTACIESIYWVSLVSLVGGPGRALYEVLVYQIQIFQPDGLTAMLAELVSFVMGDSFLAQCDQELNWFTLWRMRCLPRLLFFLHLLCAMMPAAN